MSKYTEAIEFLEHLEGKDLEFSWTDSGITELLKARDLAVEALEIADRLEQADADVYNKCCEVCTSLKACKERGEMCDEASAWEDGYNQALSDVRGDEE